MKRPHPSMAASTRMVIMLKRNPSHEADFGHRIEIEEVDITDPAVFIPPRETRAYAFFWRHEVTVATEEGSVDTVVLQAIGGLFTDSPNWPTQQTICHDTNCPALLGSDPLPYSLLWAGHTGRPVTVRRMQ